MSERIRSTVAGILHVRLTERYAILILACEIRREEREKVIAHCITGALRPVGGAAPAVLGAIGGTR